MNIIKKTIKFKDVEYLIQSECDEYSMWLRIFVSIGLDNFSFKDEIFNREILIDLEKDIFEIEWLDSDKNLVIFDELRSAANDVAEETFKLLKKVHKMKAFL